ncbi:MAG TPA: DUF1583 domain-containing protein [Gemmataceae bacterium]|nr:DUF1583 domain-containing protein [Gemmataceae bacterium]
MPINQTNLFALKASLVCLVLGLALLIPQHDTAAQDGKTGKKTADVPKDEAPKHKDKYTQEYKHSFKGDTDLDPLFHWHGEEPQGCTEFDPSGLLLHLPDGHPGKRMGTGIGINTPIKGDFEITLRYDMIKEPTPAEAGQGTGIFLWVDIDKKGLNRGYVSRVTKPGKQFGIWSHLARGEGQKPVDVTRTFPANDSSGRLRIVRTGATLCYYASEGANGEFKFLYHHSFPTDEIDAVRWGGTTGGPKASLEARFVDLDIRADDLPNLPKNKVAQSGKQEDAPGPAATPRRTFPWLIVALAAGAFIVLAVTFVGGLVLYMKRKS